MQLEINALKKQVHTLTEALRTTKATLTLTEKKLHQSVEAYDRLLAAFKQLQRREFGPRSERFIDKTPCQGDLFSSVTPTSLAEETIHMEEEQDASSAATAPVEPKRKQPRKKNFAKNLPRREVIIPVEKAATDVVIRYDITELLHYVPPVYEIIIQKREVVLRKKSQKVSELVIAPNPPRLLPKACVTESFLAQMIVGKLYDRQPFYHLEKKYAQRFDFHCTRNKLARWFIDSAKQLQGLVNLLEETALDYDVAFCDPTHLQVLNEPGRAPQTPSYVFTLQGGPPNKPVVLYQYSPTQHKLFLDAWFADYQGYLHVDGQNIFDGFIDHPKIQLVYCHSHARRKFEPIAKAAKNPGLASTAMTFYKKLYAIEREAKRDQLSPEARKQWRLTHTQPLWDEFEDWQQVC